MVNDNVGGISHILAVPQKEASLREGYLFDEHVELTISDWTKTVKLPPFVGKKWSMKENIAMEEHGSKSSITFSCPVLSKMLSERDKNTLKRGCWIVYFLDNNGNGHIAGNRYDFLRCKVGFETGTQETEAGKLPIEFFGVCADGVRPCSLVMAEY